MRRFPLSPPSLDRLPRPPRTIRIPTELRLPRLSPPKLAPLTLERLTAMSPALGAFFYLLMFVAVLAIFAGNSGAGVFMLVVGAGLHVVRSSIEEIAARHRARQGRKSEVRLRSHRSARSRAARPSPVAATPVAEPAPPPEPTPVPARPAPQIRVAATPSATRVKRRVSVR